MTPQDQVLDRYRQRMDDLTTATVDGAQTLYAQWDDGSLSTETAVLLIAALLNRAKAQATALADDYLSLQITVQAGEVTPPVGIPATDDSARLADAVSTVLEEDSGGAARPLRQPSAAPRVTTLDSAESPAVEERRDNPRLTRLAQSEPWESAQRGTGEAMQKQKLVQGWVRELNPGACTLCKYFAARGRVFPADYPFKRHPNCQCSQRVVLVAESDIKPVRERKRRA